MSHEERDATMTLEALADTVIPGAKRCPEDRAVAGAAAGPGAVEAGAVQLLNTPATGVTEMLPYLVVALNGHAREYAAERGLDLAEDVPPFVGLPFADRTALLHSLTLPDHPEREAWVGLVLFSNMAYDSAAHLHTVEAMAAGHPGLRSMGFATPDADGLWRFPSYTYGRPLAALHPATTASGSPA
jgi:hypothetical protein